MGKRLTPIMCVAQTTINLMVGRLVEEGRLDLSRKVSEIVPEMGDGYRDATLQQVLDMVVTNLFVEGYADDYLDASVATGYSRQEVGLGWRLAPVRQNTVAAGCCYSLSAHSAREQQGSPHV